MNGGLQANHLSISGILAQEGIVFPFCAERWYLSCVLKKKSTRAKRACHPSIDQWRSISLFDINLEIINLEIICLLLYQIHA